MSFSPPIALPETAASGSCSESETYGGHERTAYFAVGLLLTLIFIFNGIASLDAMFPFSVGASAYLTPAFLIGVSLWPRRLGYVRISSFLAAKGLIVTTTLATYVMSFQLHAFGMPSADKLLHSVDVALGVDWSAITHAIGSNGYIFVFFGLSYHSIPFQLFVILILKAFSSPTDNIYRFVALVALSSFIGVIIAALLPGIGMLEWVDKVDFPKFTFAAATPADLVDAMRRHDISAIDLSIKKAGMLTFPSFHALYACLCVYGFYRTPFFRIAIVLNLVMAFAAIAFGAHYVIDIIGGVATFGIALVCLNPIVRLACGRQEDPAWTPAT